MTDKSVTDGGDGNDHSDQSLHLSYSIEETEAPSTAVARATAILTDTAHPDLDPLYDVIDPDYLDGAIETADSSVHAEFSFTFNQCEVIVTQSEVTARKLDGENL